MSLSSLPQYAVTVFVVALFVVCASSVFGIISVVESAIKKRFSLPFIISFVLSLFVLTAVDIELLYVNSSKVTGAFFKAFEHVSLFAAAAVIAVCAVLNTVFLIKVRKTVNRTLTPSSLQQGLDEMTDGICMFDRHGNPVLFNKTMQKICSEAFGTATPDVALFCPPDQTKMASGCRLESYEDKTYLILPDDSIWDIEINSINTGYGDTPECIAYCVTELYIKNKLIEKRNRHLAAVNEKIKDYNKRMNSMIRDRELLAAKIRIHDDMGRALLSLSSYLSKKDADKDALVKLWKTTVSVMRCETDPDISSDKMEAISQAADAVGVSLVIDGAVPSAGILSEITALAVRECLTNTVKHANGTVLYIKIIQKDGVYTVRLKNNGKQPDGPIKETGGLRTLRSRVEQNGGIMTVDRKNGFELSVTIFENGGV